MNQAGERAQPGAAGESSRRCSIVAPISPRDERHWIVRLTHRGADVLGDHTEWYGGFGGLIRWRTVIDRMDAHRFVSFLDAVITKEKLLALGIADQAEIEEA
jgi:hypothetical protein